MMFTTQHPQLVRGLFLLDDRANRLKSIEVILLVGKGHKVAGEEVCSISDAEEAVLYKLLESLIVNTCYSFPQFSPQPLNPAKCQI